MQLFLTFLVSVSCGSGVGVFTVSICSCDRERARGIGCGRWEAKFIRGYIPFLFMREHKGLKMQKHGNTNSLTVKSADLLHDSLHILEEFVQLQRRDVRVSKKKIKHV